MFLVRSCSFGPLELLSDAAQTYRRRAPRGIAARQVRAHGAVAELKTPMTQSSGTPSAPELAQSYIGNPTTPTKNGNPFRILTTERRQSLLPSYHTSASSPRSPPYPATDVGKDPVSPTSRYSRPTACTKKKVVGLFGRNRDSVQPPLPSSNPEISAPMGVNPQFAHLVQRPDSALHPSRTGESEAFRWRAS